MDLVLTIVAKSIGNSDLSHLYHISNCLHDVSTQKFKEI